MHSHKPIIGVHLDLKYQIPSKPYLLQWVQSLPAMGVNTLLIEYEDKFPYQKYPFLQAKEAFTRQELQLFLSTARAAGLQIIPLVQTLSHLEFALGHEQLAHLRVASDTPTLLDISNPKASAFVKELLDEVLGFHEQDPLFHLGGDEVWHLGLNDRTAAMLKNDGLLNTWVAHITQFVDHAKQAGKRAIVWDDIFWKVTPEEIKHCSLSRDVIFHCWNYAAKCNEKSLASLSQRVSSYHDAGFTAIGAPCLNWGVGTPRHEHCLENTRAWAITSEKLDMAGIINTAWSCFHVMPHATTVQIAAMGQMIKAPERPLEVSWQEQFMGRHFGCDATGFVKAMENVEAFWELDVKLSRPLTVIWYGNMDMVLWYGSQETRMKRGAYPIDFDSIDFDDVFRQKFDYFKQADQDGSVSAQLQMYHAKLVSAAATLTPIAAAATANAPEAGYLAFTAKLKKVYVELLLELIQTQKPTPDTANRWQQLGDEFASVMTPLMDEYSAKDFKRMWWQPMTSFMISDACDLATKSSASTSKDMAFD